MKSIFKILVLFFCIQNVVAQNDSVPANTDQPFLLKLLDNKNNKAFGEFSFGAYRPIFNGGDYLDNTFEPNPGIYLNFSFFIYKQFHIGYKLNSNHLSVVDSSVRGFRSSNLTESFFYFGYEFVPTDRLRLGIEYSPFVDFELNNNAGDDIGFSDDGDGNYFNFTVNYEVMKGLHLFVSYGFNNITTDIRVPSQLEDTFRNLSYNHFSVGFKVYFGKQDLINSFINPI